MTNEQHSQNDKEDSASTPDQKPVVFAGESRRRFTKTGFAASGVLMTLASRPALACKAVSPSGFCSANQSTHGGPKESQGCGPSHWASCSWPIPKTTKFHSVFKCAPAWAFYNCTLLDVLNNKNVKKGTSSSEITCAQRFVAAYLNACAGLTPFLQQGKVTEMCNEWRSTGCFKPSAGVTWYAADITNYFRNTQLG